MDVVPLIYLKNHKKFGNYNQGRLKTEDILRQLETFKDKKLYVLDLDGIKKNRPNLQMYQELSTLAKIWVDAGPRDLGDIVDILITGAETVVLREKNWSRVPIAKIKELTENDVFCKIDIEEGDIKDFSSWSFLDFDGAVLLDEKENIKRDFYNVGVLKKICGKKKVYVFENDPENYFFWEKKNISGLLVEINDLKGFKK